MHPPLNAAVDKRAAVAAKRLRRSVTLDLSSLDPRLALADAESVVGAMLLVFGRDLTIIAVPRGLPVVE
jgi:hypothetical protein